MSGMIQTLLDLKTAPIAITFCDQPPAGVPRVERAEPGAADLLGAPRGDRGGAQRVELRMCGQPRVHRRGGSRGLLRRAGSAAGGARVAARNRRAGPSGTRQVPPAAAADALIRLA